MKKKLLNFLNVAQLRQLSDFFFIVNEWGFLSENWRKINFKYKHRTNIKHIKGINEIKKELLDRLEYTSVFFFLNKILYT